MGAQAGIIVEPGSLTSPRVVQALGLANTHRGPDRSGSYVGDGVALTHYAAHFDDLAARERQPLLLADGSVLTFDGRLDNREDFLLRLRDVSERPATDVAIVGAAWLAWGAAAFARLIGDWSLALWNSRERTLTLARDYMGNRPLFYYHANRQFAWSTCLEPLIDMFDLYERVDEHFIAGILTFGAPPHRTPFEGLRSVPASHCLRFRWPDDLQISQYWDLPRDVIRHQNEESYADRLRELFVEAVRVRLRASGPVWAHLSGGYDSSSIACAATHLVRSGAADAPAIRLISRTFRNAPESDETPHIRAVEQWIGQRTTPVDDARDWTLTDLTLPIVPFAGQDADAPSTIAVRASGGHTVLSGELGDLVMAKSKGHATALVELLPHLKIAQFWTGLMTWSQRRREPWPQTLTQILTPYAPTRFSDFLYRRQLVSIVTRRLGTRATSIHSAFGLQPDFVARTQPTPLELAVLSRGFAPSKRGLARLLYRSILIGSTQTSVTPISINLTFPFVHRPLVEFVLAIPHMMLWRPSEPRALMRRALGGFLPDAVLARKGKGDPAAGIIRFHRAIAEELLENASSWELVTRGYVAADMFRTQFGGVLNGSLSDPSHIPRLVTLEGWLRGIPERRQRLRSLYGIDRPTPNAAHLRVSETGVTTIA